MSKKSNTKAAANPTTAEVPTPPKRPLSAYFRWLGENREFYKKKNPNLKNTELVSLLGSEWSKIGENMKKKFNDAYDKEKKKYDEEMKAFTDKNGPIIKKSKVLEKEEKKGKKSKKESSKK